MIFVGREKEIRTITEALVRGENVVVTGKFGIGRTALIRHIAQTSQSRWRFVFVDFSRTANQACQHVMKELFPHLKHESLRYKPARFKLIKEDVRDKRQPILVLDNIGKLPAPKFGFIRYLSFSKRFRFISIVEHFVPEDDVLHLRAELFPAALIVLQRLRKADALNFFRRCSDQHRFHWDEGRLKNLAGETHGYPLLMREAVERELRKEKVSAHGSPPARG